MKELLICGHRSFVATGFTSNLDAIGRSYDFFSRGEEKKEGREITGDVMNMTENQFLDSYDTVINFIIIKGQGVDENIQYAKSILQFCVKQKVKRLIQISSISVYPNQSNYINEESDIESDYSNKGGYASVKVAVDHYLQEHSPKDLDVVFVRPGFIYDKKVDISSSGIFVKTPFGKVLLGDKKTSLPLVSKTKLHEALLAIISTTNKKRVYLILNKDKSEGTKYNFVKQQWGGKIHTLPSWAFLFPAKILHSIKILKTAHYLKVVGLFKRTWFDSEISEQTLQMNLGKLSFCIIGSGAYGSYIANLLGKTYPHEKIDIIEVGDKKLQDEKEIGYLSKVIDAPYSGLTKGRFFGYGGASVKWGGQLFTFSQNDFAHPSEFMKGVVELNVKYKNRILSRFGLSNNYKEKVISNNLFIKSGIWLSYFHRNLFKFFKVKKIRNIRLIPNSRVTKLNLENGLITSVQHKSKGSVHNVVYDHYFLAAGAFESSRILINSNIITSRELPFSDHLSQKVFKVKSGTKIGNDDFRFDIKGASLVTKRLVGEVNDISFYCHPIFNQDFPFFQNLKKLLFGRKLSIGIITNIIKDIPHCIAFAWSILVNKKMYVYKNEFYLQIDIENPSTSGNMILTDERDKFEESGLIIDFHVDEKTADLFAKARSVVRQYLDANSVIYEEVQESTQVEKYEDTYHPYGSYCNFDSIDDYFNRIPNLLVTNTAILQRAGGINSTCAVMPLIEEYVDNIMK